MGGRGEYFPVGIGCYRNALDVSGYSLNNNGAID